MRCCSSSHCRIAQSSMTSCAVATSTGIPAGDAISESRRRESTTAASRWFAGLSRQRAGAANRNILERFLAAPTHSGSNAMVGADNFTPEERAEFTLTLRHRPCWRPFDFQRLVEEEGIAEDVTQCCVLERDGQCWVRGLYDCEFSIIQRRHLDDGVIDPGGLQEAGTHEVDGIIAARKDDPCCRIGAREGHEIAESVTRGAFEQALDALNEDDFAALCSKDGAEGGGIGRHLGGMQRGVEVWLCELLNPETKREVFWRQDRDGVLPDRGLAAAGWTRDDHNLNVFEHLQDLLDESGSLEVESIPNGGANVVERDLRMVLERAENLLLAVPIGEWRSRSRAGRSPRRKVRACGMAALASVTRAFHEAAAAATGSPSWAVCASSVFMCAST